MGALRKVWSISTLGVADFNSKKEIQKKQMKVETAILKEQLNQLRAEGAGPPASPPRTLAEITAEGKIQRAAIRQAGRAAVAENRANWAERDATTPPSRNPLSQDSKGNRAIRAKREARRNPDHGSQLSWNPPPGWPAAPEGWTMPTGWQPSPDWPPAPAGWIFWQRSEAASDSTTTSTGPGPAKSKPPMWIAGLVGLVVVGGIIAAAGSSSADTKKSEPSKASASSPTASKLTAQEENTKAAREWIDKYAHDTNAVKVAVESVQMGIGILQHSSGPAELAGFSALVKQAKGYLSDANGALVGSTSGKDKMGAERENAWYGANRLESAMGELRNYLDSSKPSDLADFQEKYNEGVQLWNSSVKALYKAAGRSKPPVIG